MTLLVEEPQRVNKKSFRKNVPFLVSQLRCFLKKDSDARNCKTSSRRLEFVEDICSSMSREDVDKKYFPNSNSSKNQSAKFLRRICLYSGLEENVTFNEIKRMKDPREYRINVRSESYRAFSILMDYLDSSCHKGSKNKFGFFKNKKGVTVAAII